MTRPRWTRLTLRILAWVVTTALVAWVFVTTDFSAFGDALKRADVAAFLGLAVTFNLAHLLLDAAGVGILLRKTGIGLPFGRLVAIRAASYLFGFVNYNLGLILIAAAAGKDRDTRWQTLVSPLLALNVFDLFILGIPLVAGLTVGGLPESPDAFSPLMIAGVGSILAPVVMVALSRSHLKPARFLSGLLDTFRALDARSLVLVLVLRAVLLFSDAAGDLLMLSTFNLAIPIDVFARFFPIDSFACVLPITVAGIGPTLILMRVFFAPFTPAASGSLAAIDAFSVSATTSLVFIRTALALVCLPSLSGLLDGARKGRTQD